MVRKFADERLNLIMRTYREDEMVQAAHRIRPLLNPEEKEIFLISNLPIKELPPQELLTLDDLIGDGENSMSRLNHFIFTISSQHQI